MKYSGSCLCGKVTFEVDGEFQHFFLCHCAYCRKDTGSAHAANLFSSAAVIRWLAGEDQISTYKLPNTRHQRSFCASCGSALPNVQQGDLLVVPAGCLDSDIPIPPSAHIFVGSRANWDSSLENVFSFEGGPE
ncbi:GFA family protein [Thiocapsa bogorovii]|uniref:GFA family protein n=1 Tax=Thiocapsa bogorovii TaxID=521689 RepID=UPI001E43E3F6|nr:GFA family protein [Thiocapsa bogorovii]UHD17860.1 GFA family protein [Thiocapsa bogorovii]